jgi:hypothetical protein
MDDWSDAVRKDLARLVKLDRLFPRGMVNWGHLGFDFVYLWV